MGAGGGHRTPTDLAALAAAGLSGRDRALVRILRLPRPSPETLWWVGLTCTTVFGLLLLAEGIRIWRRRRAAVRRRARRFREVAARAGLDPREWRLLRRALSGARPTHAIRALESGAEYTRLVDRTVERMRRRSAPDVAGTLQRFGAIRGKLGLDRARPGVPIESTRELDTGRFVRVSTSVDGASYHWPATLLESDEERLILRIDEPCRRVAGGGLVLRGGITVSPGDELAFYFWREGDAGYRFRQRIEEVRFRGKGLLVVPHPRRLERRQEREFVRAALDAEVRYRRIPGPLFARIVGREDRVPSGRLRRARLVDLSGGGVRLRAADTFEAGDAIAIEPPFLPGLDLEEPLYARRTRHAGRGDGSHAFAFVGIGEPLRDRIVGYVYRVQRERRREAEAVAASGTDAVHG